jgi:hypothetical protein
MACLGGCSIGGNNKSKNKAVVRADKLYLSALTPQLEDEGKATQYAYIATILRIRSARSMSASRSPPTS